MKNKESANHEMPGFQTSHSIFIYNTRSEENQQFELTRVST